MRKEPILSALTPSPAPPSSVDMNTGITGSMQGEKNDNTPARKTPPNSIPGIIASLNITSLQYAFYIIYAFLSVSKSL
jgi:hypothetical protein